MKRNLDRREFVKRVVATGAGLLTGRSVSKALLVQTASAKAEICSVVGDRYFDNTFRAVDALGGMKRFVHRGNTVGILVNSPFGNRGTFTNPDITAAVVKMCLDSGAKQVIAFREIPERYWKRGSHCESLKSEIGGIAYPDETTRVTIDRGKVLKAAEVSSALLSCDVFVNIPIIKDHEGTRFTCTLKNMMGACAGSTCRRMHFGDSSIITGLFKGYYSNVEVLAQSIADLNLVRRPDLSVVDATEILSTNGPSGPGEIRTPREVIASTDGLAADMYACRHLGLNWEELPVITCARHHGYGPEDLRSVDVRVI